jgi:hypothetical protein
MELARFLGVSMSADLILSCMAMPASTLRLLEARPGKKPAIIEWMPPTASGHHPDWKPVAQSLRDSSGQIIPNLLRRYPVLGDQMPSRIAAFGFSAGSNSGLRELIRSPADREMLSFVGSIDGLHFRMQDGSIEAPADYDPWVKLAVEAVLGKKWVVFTGNNIPPPTPITTRTSEGMRMVNRSVIDYLGSEKLSRRYPPRLEVMQEFVSYGPPLPNGQGGLGNCYWFEYPGTQAADHVTQASTIIPRVMDTFLAAAWGAKPGMEA